MPSYPRLHEAGPVPLPWFSKALQGLAIAEMQLIGLSTKGEGRSGGGGV